MNGGYLMIEINLIDEAGVLSPSEFERLRDFIINNCLCTSDEVAKLQAVKLRNDGASGYSGYWSGRYTRIEADTRFETAVIVLNSYYLKTVEQMERTLAHEFGHHWTLGYFMDREEMIGWFDESAPWLYYRIRGLDPDEYTKDYSKGWSHCDKEVLAEDFKYKFSPYGGTHRMKSETGNPTAEVGEYIKELGKPYWL
jgi:hypothetical protein